MMRACLLWCLLLTTASGHAASIAELQRLMHNEPASSVRRAFRAKRLQVQGGRSFCRGNEDLSGRRPLHPASAGAVLAALRTLYGSDVVDQALRADEDQGFGLSHPRHRAGAGKGKARGLPPEQAIFVDLAELPIGIMSGMAALSRTVKQPQQPIADTSPLFRALRETSLSGHDLVQLRRGKAPSPTAALDDLLGRRRQAIARIGRRFGLGSIRLFGSASRRQEHPDSDLDFLVELPAGRDYGVLDELRQELSRVTGRKVDVAPIEFFPPSLRERIEAGAISLWSPGT
jgi:predicted nucleotidyltransferase